MVAARAPLRTRSPPAFLGCHPLTRLHALRAAQAEGGRQTTFRREGRQKEAAKLRMNKRGQAADRRRASYRLREEKQKYRAEGACCCSPAHYTTYAQNYHTRHLHSLHHTFTRVGRGRGKEETDRRRRKALTITHKKEGGERHASLSPAYHGSRWKEAALKKKNSSTRKGKALLPLFVRTITSAHYAGWTAKLA